MARNSEAKAADELTYVLGLGFEGGSTGGGSPISQPCRLSSNLLRSATGKPVRDRGTEQSEEREQKEQCR